MYPYDLFWDITLYDLLLGAGVVCAIFILRYFADRDGISTKYYNFLLAAVFTTVCLGYLLAVVSQGIYNAIESGRFVLDMHTGATFLGGLAGGAAVFFTLYFGVGHFVFKDRENYKNLLWITDTAAVCIPAAHSIGRLGCLTAGCCYGLVFEQSRWYTFKFPILDAHDCVIGYRNAIPVQLLESVFLALLALWLGVRKKKKKNNGLSLYMIFYGVWRFFAEYIRADDRGKTIVDFLSPSQLISLLMFAGGIILYFLLQRKMIKEKVVGVSEIMLSSDEQCSDKKGDSEFPITKSGRQSQGDTQAVFTPRDGQDDEVE